VGAAPHTAGASTSAGLPAAGPGCAGASLQSASSLAGQGSAARPSPADPSSPPSPTRNLSGPPMANPAAALPPVGELWHLLAHALPEELRVRLAGTPAQAFLAPGNEKMFGSMRSVAITAGAALEHIAAQRATPFSIRSWIHPGCPGAAGPSPNPASGDARPGARPSGVLFLPYTAGEIATLRSVIATWLRLAIFEAMNGPEGDQRLWFVIDELDALGAIDGLKDALARLRKFGGR